MLKKKGLNRIMNLVSLELKQSYHEQLDVAHCSTQNYLEFITNLSLSFLCGFYLGYWLVLK